MSKELKEILNPFKELRELFEKEFLENEKIKYGYGILIPKDDFKKEVLCDLLKNSAILEDYYIKNLNLGAFLYQVKEALNISVKSFAQLLGKRRASIQNIFQNKESTNINKLLKLLNQPNIKKLLDEKELTRLKEKIGAFITHSNSVITRQGSHAILNFNLNNLQRIKLGIQEYIILPQSRWEIKVELERVQNWALGFYFLTSLFGLFSGKKGRSPKMKEIKAEFGGGIYRNLEKYGITHNILLKCWDIPENLEFKCDWNDSKTWEKVRAWAQAFYCITSFFGLFLRRKGRSPKIREVDTKFGGFSSAIQKIGKTYNDMLKIWKIPYNILYKFDWNDRNSWRLVKTWARGFFVVTYIFNPFTKEIIRAPKYVEMAAHFGGGYKSYLTRKGIFHNDLMKSWDISVFDVKKRAKEGVLFDKIGKKCLLFISDKAIRGTHVVHPELEKYNKKWIVPDGIIHNFDKRPLKRIKKTIRLQIGQKLDRILDFKRVFGSMTSKDWEQYSIIAKRMDIYLLRGSSRMHKLNGCDIIFHSIRELISILRGKNKQGNKQKIDLLIEKIMNLRHGIIDNSQKKLD